VSVPEKIVPIDNLEPGQSLLAFSITPREGAVVIKAMSRRTPQDLWHETVQSNIPTQAKLWEELVTAYEIAVGGGA
jgi:hypothetical protein